MCDLRERGGLYRLHVDEGAHVRGGLSVVNVQAEGNGAFESVVSRSTLPLGRC